ncbi:hypothetical protein SUGI_1189940 [Cryptomeria japonica]|nr:hypothetical protein SUGI_1189940 [Cryptomeria japonica]
MEAQAVDKSTEIKSSKKNEMFENKSNTAHSEKVVVGLETKSKVKEAATDTTTIANIKGKGEKIRVDEDGSVDASSTREITVTELSAPVVGSGSPGQTN